MEHPLIIETSNMYYNDKLILGHLLEFHDNASDTIDGVNIHLMIISYKSNSMTNMEFYTIHKTISLFIAEIQDIKLKYRNTSLIS